MISNDPSLEFERGAAQALLRRLIGRIWELEAEREFWTIAPRKKMLALVTSEKSATVKSLRRVAYWLGIDFPGLLAGELQSYTGQLDPNWLATLPEAMRPPKRRRLVDREKLAIRLRAFRESIDPDRPPCLADVAKSVWVSTGGLEYVHPAVCKEIKENHRRWLVVERGRKRVKALVEVWGYLESDVAPKTRKGALREIMERTSLPKNLLREVIASEFDKASQSVRRNASDDPSGCAEGTM